ncbi:MAG TPA: ester cyclase [Gaiellaceae bacterium]|nr:ester cyclase [Gaiellaceae bacterium]
MADAKEIVRRLTEESWKDPSVIDELVSADYVGYDPAEPEPVRGIAGLKEQLEKYQAAFEGAHVTIDEQFAEGDIVATRWTGQGTHTGEIAGVAPTGKEVTVTGITISRVADGKVVEERQVWDTLGMLVQLGAVPAPTAA